MASLLLLTSGGVALDARRDNSQVGGCLSKSRLPQRAKRVA